MAWSLQKHWLNKLFLLEAIGFRYLVRVGELFNIVVLSLQAFFFNPKLCLFGDILAEEDIGLQRIQSHSPFPLKEWSIKLCLRTQDRTVLTCSLLINTVFMRSMVFLTTE